MCSGYRLLFCCFFFFKQKTAYEMRISDWSSDVCSSDLTVTVSGPDGPVTLVTDAAGGYFVGELPPGDYTIALTVPDGYTADVKIGRASCRERVCQYV